MWSRCHLELLASHSPSVCIILWQNFKNCSGSLVEKFNFLNGCNCSAVANFGYFSWASAQLELFVPLMNADCTLCSCLIETHSLFISAGEIFPSATSLGREHTTSSEIPLRHLNLLPLRSGGFANVPFFDLGICWLFRTPSANFGRL